MKAQAEAELVRLLQTPGHTEAELDDAKTILTATTAEYEAAKAEAETRGRVSSGSARRDAVLTRDQELNREQLWSLLQLDPEKTKTPPTSNFKVGTTLDEWAYVALKKWSDHCNAMGQSSIARWFIVATLLKIGPPPGWEGDWPPDEGGEP
jgi:hypothetical protein